MTPQDRLKKMAEEFLENTEHIYEYCQDGIKDLDRIIVSVHHSMSSTTRGYLVPILYAYWERFFKSVLLEYLRCIEQAKIDLPDIAKRVYQNRLTKELSSISKSKGIPQLHMIPQKFDVDEFTSFLKDVDSVLASPLAFPSNIDWVNTESNVTAEVVKKQCTKFMIDFEAIRDELKAKDYRIFSDLKDLVTNRNSIAHGEEFGPVTSDEWDKYKGLVKMLMWILEETLHRHLESDQTILA